MTKYLIISICVVFIATAFLVTRLSEFELIGFGQQRTISFASQQNRLEGTLILPNEKIAPPVVIIVHGDGAQDRWSDEGYLPLVNALLSRGIGVFSWDKPGVGKSSGNWLAQTMAERSHEAELALRKLKQEPGLEKSRIGYLGFSQAGWVVPQASHLTKADFVVLVGVAVNWREQGLYYMKQRLKIEALPDDKILLALEKEKSAFDAQFTRDTASRPCAADCNRQDFDRRNSLADARKDISVMHVPVMLLMGENDRNVDPFESVSVWNALLPEETSRCIKQISSATHGLLRSQWFDYQLPTQWPWWKQWLFLLSGKHAYAPGVIDNISGWILNQKC